MAPKFAIDIHADAADLLQAAINFGGSGSNVIVAGVTGQIIRVYKVFFIVGAATSIIYQDGITNVTGSLQFSANEGMILDFDTKPWFIGTPGNAFNLFSQNAVQVGGAVYYTQGL